MEPGSCMQGKAMPLYKESLKCARGQERFAAPDWASQLGAAVQARVQLCMPRQGSMLS